METIKFFDLKQQTQSLKQEILQELEQVLETTQFTLGNQVAAFEEAFASFCGVRHAVAVNTGTNAVHIALAAAGVGPGDEVITTPHTFIATVAAIAYAGATPVFVDIDPHTFNIDPARLEGAISERTKAIVPVHLYGQPAMMGQVCAVASRYQLVVVEDSAQAHGATYNGRRTGSWGHLGCFSFYPSKNLGACGEGGIVTTDDDRLDERLRMLRDWGMREKNVHELLGFNMRMSGFQGAVLSVKLRHLERWNEQRRDRAAAYTKALAEQGVEPPAVATHAEHVYHLYVVRVPRRPEVKAKLQGFGVHTAVHYPTPVHLQPAFAHLGHKSGDFPEAERAASTVLSLPMYPEMPLGVPALVADRLGRALSEV